MQIIPIVIFSLAFALTSTTAGPATTTDKVKDDLISNSVNPELKDKDEYKPQVTTEPEIKPGFAVARIIDDIFQIPIGVLQSVSRLLRNPFIQHNKTPETVSSY